MIFPERGGNVRELRVQQQHRVWLTIAGIAAALMVAGFVYLLLAAYQDIVDVTHLRQELAATSHVRAHNSTLRKLLATDQVQNQQALTQTLAMSADLNHVAGILGLSVTSTSPGLGSLSTHLQVIQQQLPKVLTAAEARDSYLAHKPDMLPVNGPITSWFGWRPNPFTGTGSEFHPGLDIGVPMNTPVLSPGAGVVTYAGWRAGGYGYYVQINNGYGIVSYFAHNSKVLVHVGEHVTRGQVLALSGTTGRSTGPHVYFGIHYHGIPINPWPFIHSNPPSIN